MGQLRGIAERALAVARQEVALLAVLALLATSLWIFVGLSEEVVEGETLALDQSILLTFRTPGDLSDPLGPGWVEELGRDVTALGGIGVLIFITVASAIYLALCGKYRGAAFVVTAIATGIALSFALKAGFDRPRPDLVPHGTLVHTTSFPSGHSMMAAIVYLTLGALLARLHPEKGLKAYLLLLAILVTIAVGVSRVYLGVHWPTDVLAGWAAGATWAMMSWAAVLWMQRYRKAEAPADEKETTSSQEP